MADTNDSQNPKPEFTPPANAAAFNSQDNVAAVHHSMTGKDSKRASDDFQFKGILQIKDQETRMESKKCDDEVSQWLISEGFGRFVPFFKMRSIDMNALVLLTLDDLREMGIQSAASRNKIYNAIQNHRNAALGDSG